MKHVSIVRLLLVVSCSTVLLAQTLAKDPRIGNWKLNPAKSTYPAGTNAPQMAARTYATRPDGYSVITQATIGAQGNAFFNQGIYKVDGKPYPTYNTTSLADFDAAGTKPGTAAFKLLDPNTVEITFRDNAGKVTSMATNTVSKDGKSLTVTNKDATGKAVPGATVWDKQ